MNGVLTIWQGNKHIQKTIKHSMVLNTKRKRKQRLFFFFIKIILSRSKENFTGKPVSLSCSLIWTHFELIKQKWARKEITIFSNSGHLEWRVDLLNMIWKVDHPRIITYKFCLICHSGIWENFKCENFMMEAN